MTTPVRYFAREALARRGAAQYALREAPRVRVLLRHGTPDMEVFDEVFVQRLYAAPAAVARALAAIGRPLRIVDVGANVGLFSAWASVRWPTARITCVEPDPFNLPILERAIAANGGRWALMPAAASAADGRLAFLAGNFATSRGLAARDGAGGEATVDVPMRDILPTLAAADLVKIDIEGGEWPILADPRFATMLAGVRAIAIEFHPEGCPCADAREAACTLLRRAGFSAIEPVASRAPPGYGSLWAWRPPAGAGGAR